MDLKKYFTYDLKVLNEDDLKDIYDLCKKNREYYKCIRINPTLDNVKEILNDIPPKSSKDKKNCIGLYLKNKLVAILYLIEDYPNNDSCFIGLLIIDVDYQGKGRGKDITTSLIKTVKENGYKRIELGVIEDNVSAIKFWNKMGFIPTGTIYNHEKYNVIMMEKVL